MHAINLYRYKQNVIHSRASPSRFFYSPLSPTKFINKISTASACQRAKRADIKFDQMRNNRYKVNYGAIQVYSLIFEQDTKVQYPKKATLHRPIEFIASEFDMIVQDKIVFAIENHKRRWGNGSTFKNTPLHCCGFHLLCKKLAPIAISFQVFFFSKSFNKGKLRKNRLICANYGRWKKQHKKEVAFFVPLCTIHSIISLVRCKDSSEFSHWMRKLCDFSEIPCYLLNLIPFA